MAHCTLCERNSADISQVLGICLACIRRRPQEALAIAAQVHRQSRLEFGLPAKPPDEPEGVTCRVCMNRCRIPENETGYCPQFLMSDMPVTSKSLAKECLQVARDCGLTCVRLGNEHLLR